MNGTQKGAGTRKIVIPQVKTFKSAALKCAAQLQTESAFPFRQLEMNI